MEDITKFFAAPEGAPAFEIDVKTQEEAAEYIKKNFRGSGEVRLIMSVYRHLYSIPHLVKT